MERMIGQAEIFGKTRHRRNRAGSLMLPYPRTPRVFYGITSSGVLQPLPVSQMKGINPSDFPHLERGAEALLDLPVKPSWTTVRRRKTTIGGYAVIDTGRRQPKRGGFDSEHERRRIRQIRRENELRRNLLAAGIDKHKLFLLMHSAYHSQMLLERPPAKKLSPKTGGFVSHNEVMIMRKQRRRNQRLATSGTIYRY